MSDIIKRLLRQTLDRVTELEAQLAKVTAERDIYYDGCAKHMKRAEELEAQLEKTATKRDTFRAVLVGAEYRNLDSISSIEDGRALGEEVKHLTMELKAQLDKVTAERDDFKQRSENYSTLANINQHGWDDQRERAEAAEAAEAAIHRAYRMGLEDAARAIVEPISTYIYDVLYKQRLPVISHTHQNTYERAQKAIRAIPTPTNLVERAMKEAALDKLAELGQEYDNE